MKSEDLLLSELFILLKTISRQIGDEAAVHRIDDDLIKRQGEIIEAIRVKSEETYG